MTRIPETEIERLKQAVTNQGLGLAQAPLVTKSTVQRPDASVDADTHRSCNRWSTTTTRP
jgi:endonuclease III